MSEQIDTENDNGNGTVRAEQQDLPAGIVLQPGQRLLKNGAVMGADGKFVANIPELNPHAITKETTHKYHELRRERVQEAVQRGIIAGADRRDIDASIGAITEAQTHIALNEMAGRASTEAARFVFQAAGFMPGKQEPDNNVARDIGRGIADVLCRLLQDNSGFIAENDIIDAEIVGNGKDNGSESG